MLDFIFRFLLILVLKLNFYCNHFCYRYGQPDFYVKKETKDEEPEPVLPTMKISELKKLTEDYIEVHIIHKNQEEMVFNT